MSNIFRANPIELILIAFTLVIGTFIVGLGIWDYTDSGFTDRDRAMVETVIVAKEAVYQSRNKVAYRYFIQTDVDGAGCEYHGTDSGVMVNGKLHECPLSSAEVETTEAEWNNIKVGHVLKRVELK